jgi:hypothetical protein
MLRVKILHSIVFALVLNLFPVFTYAQTAYSNEVYNIFFNHNFENNTPGNYLDSEWRFDWNYPPWVNREVPPEIIKDSESALNGSKYLRFHFPAGGVGPSLGGGQWLTTIEGSPEELYLSYNLRFKPGFEWVLGGKVPGLRGGPLWNNFGAPPWDGGFAVLLMWTRDAGLQFYYYHHDLTHEYGDGKTWSYTFSPGKWYNIGIRVVLNTIGANGGINDGLIEGYVDGKLVALVTGLRLRNLSSIKIDQLYMASFYGGSGVEYAPQNDQWLDLDDFVVFTYQNSVEVVRGNKANPYFTQLIFPFASIFNTVWQNGIKASAISARSVKISWLDYSAPGNYTLERRREDETSFKVLQQISYGTTNYLDATVDPETRYYYRVIANGLYSNEVSVVTPQIYLPAVPGNLRYTEVGKRKVVLAWSDNSTNELGFEVWRKATAVSVYSKVTATASNITSFSDLTVLPGVQYDYQVRAYNSDGYSAFSNLLQVTTGDLEPPVAPSMLHSTEYTVTNISISWNDNSTNESGFEVWRKKSVDSVYSKVINTSTNSNRFNDLSIAPSMQYNYQVRAYNSDGFSAYSNVLQVTTPFLAPPVAPSMLHNTGNTEKSISISWNDNSSNETGFIVKRALALNPDDVSSIAINANDTFYVDNNLIPNTTYIYSIQAVNQVGNSPLSNKDIASTLSVAETKRVRDGLIAYYNFGYDPYNVIRDLSGYNEPVDLRILQPSSVSWNDLNRLEIKSNTTLVSTAPATKIVKAIKKTQQLTVECWIRPTEPFSSANARIVSLANNDADIGFVLDQFYNATDDKSLNYGSRISTTSTDESGYPEIIPDKEQSYINMQHIAYVRDSLGYETMYINGKKAAEGFRPNGFDNWKDNFYLRLGNEIDQNHPWRGTYFVMAIFNKALNDKQINDNFQAGPCDSLQREDMNYQISIYPNPATSKATIEITPEETMDFVQPGIVRMQDIMGKIYFQDKMFNPNNQFIKFLDLKNLAKGIYIVQVVSGNKSKTTKLIIN